MTLNEEIQSILNDPSTDYRVKGERLSKLVTRQELRVLLPQYEDAVMLKEPLRPRTSGMRTLTLSIYKVYFDAILAGTKLIEYRDYRNDYYKKKCTYTEGRKRYLVPFDALVLYVGRGDNALTATVALTDITCDGTYLMFHLGRVLYTNAPGWRQET